MAEIGPLADELKMAMAVEMQKLNDAVEEAMQSHMQKQQELLHCFSNHVLTLKTLKTDDSLESIDEPDEQHHGINEAVTGSYPGMRKIPALETPSASISMAERHRQYKSEIDHNNWFWTLSNRLHVKDAFTKLMQIEEPTRSGRLADFVEASHFASLCSAVILLNSVFCIYTTNYDIAHLDSGPSNFIFIMEMVFAIFYTWEIVMKLAVHRWYLFIGPGMSWNIFDFILVILAIYDQILMLLMTLEQGGQGTSVTFLRSMRILKIAKISRTIRVMRSFHSLRMILNSLLGSLYSLFWSIAMLVLIFYLFALVFVQRASLALKEGGVPDREVTLEQFGSVQVAMLTLYRSTTGGDDWSTFYDTLNGTGGINAALFIFFIAFMQIAVLNILTGIFVEQAMKAAQPDSDAMAATYRLQEMLEAEELRCQCRQIDVDGDGTITLAELAEFFETGKFQHWLMSHDVDVRDIEVFFDLLRAHEGETLSVDSFVEECMKLKGAATSIDLHWLTKRVQEFELTQKRQHREILDLLRQPTTSANSCASLPFHLSL